VVAVHRSDSLVYLSSFSNQPLSCCYESQKLVPLIWSTDAHLLLSLGYFGASCYINIDFSVLVVVFANCIRYIQAGVTVWGKLKDGDDARRSYRHSFCCTWSG